MMLEDSDIVAAVDVKSSWRVERQAQQYHASVQACFSTQQDVSVQTNAQHSIEVQTDDTLTRPSPFPTSFPHDPKLNQFLRDAAATMITELENNLTSSMGWVNDEEEEVSTVEDSSEAIKMLWTCRDKSERKRDGSDAADDEDDDEGHDVMHGGADLSWNCHGTTLAVAHGSFNHIGWCSHRSSVTLWNVSSSKGYGHAPSKPSRVLETPCCVMCIQYHPHDPPLLAGGLFNGEVRIWHTAKDDEPLIANSTLDQLHHTEPIMAVAWIRDHSTGTSSQTHTLATVSGDGKVLIWTLLNALSHPVEGYCLVPTRIYHGHGDGMNLYPIMGGVAVAFSPLDWNNFVCGTEAGGMLKCLRSSHNKFKALSRSNEVKDGEFIWSREAHDMLMSAPQSHRNDLKRSIEKYARLQHNLKRIEIAHVFAAKPNSSKLYPAASSFGYKPHNGSVSCLEFSPFHRNLFLSCSGDGSLRVNHLFRRESILMFEPSSSHTMLHHLSWSHCRPLVFACSDASGNLHLFDLLRNMKTPVCTVSAHTVPVHSLAFNPKQGDILASIDASGTLTLWELSGSLSTLQGGELSTLEKMGNMLGDDAMLDESLNPSNSHDVEPPSQDATHQLKEPVVLRQHIPSSVSSVAPLLSSASVATSSLQTHSSAISVQGSMSIEDQGGSSDPGPGGKDEDNGDANSDYGDEQYDEFVE